MRDGRWREERTVTGSLTLHYNKVLFLPEPTDVARGLARKRVTVHEFPDGRLAIRHKGRDLPYRTFDKLRRVDQAAVVENKRLGAVLAVIRERQAETARKRNGRRSARSRACASQSPSAGSPARNSRRLRPRESDGSKPSVS